MMAEGQLQFIWSLIGVVLIYIGGPIALIVWLVRRKRNPRVKEKRKYKVLRFLPIAINVPAAFMFAWAEHTGNPMQNEEIWNAVLIIAMIVTIIWSLIECKLSGLWIGPLRALIGMSAGILGSAAVIILCGLLMVMGVGGSGRRMYVNVSGEKHYLSPNGGDQYVDGAGNLFISIPESPGTVRDVWNHTYTIQYE